MNRVKVAVLAVFSVATIATGEAHAAFSSGPFYTVAGPGGLASTDPALTETWAFSSSYSGPATLTFDLVGYNSLDGWNNGYTDIFNLTLNGTTIFTGSFNLGGGGTNQIIFNPDAGTAVTTTNGLTYTGEVTFEGGTTVISIPITLGTGTQQIGFSYDSPFSYTPPASSGLPSLTGLAGPQGTFDEGWGIQSATVTSVPEPSVWGLMACGIFALGLGVVRRRS